MLTYFFAWFPMLLLAIGNGVLRESLLKKWLAEAAAHQVSTLTLIVLLWLYIRCITLRFPPASATEAIFLGALWMLLTLAFEFGFGLYRGNSWEHMLSDYNILEGKIWLLVPIWILLAPLAFFVAGQR